MNKTAIKNFAVAARKTLIELVKIRAARFGILPDEKPDSSLHAYKGYLFSKIENEQRLDLIKQIEAKSYDQVMENVAYTWFNRFCALRFMEVNGYLPSAVRVFSDENEDFKPEILSQALDLDFEWLDQKEIRAYKEKIDDEGLFKYLIVAQCNALNELLPGMFQRIGHYTELLFPDNQLKEGSVVWGLVKSIDVDDWKDQVQIIGWLYQYYNSEKKERIYAQLKKNVKISKDDIPAATQLFTPDWIVRYMVENSLGRLWNEGHPNVDLKKNWRYYLDEAEQSPEVETKLAEIRRGYAKLNPEDIKCLDPSCGSGHILVYMFDVLIQIYASKGYSERDAARLIVEKNLFGLDIDKRAGQMAYFAIMMKGREYDARFLKRGIQPHVHAVVESNGLDVGARDLFCNGDQNLTKAVDTISKELYDAEEYGSIIDVSEQNWVALEDRFNTIGQDNQYAEELEHLRKVINVAKILAGKYEIVCTNPPYMGSSGMNAKLAEFVKKNYPDEKQDLFSCFINKGNKSVVQNGFNCMVTMQSWMFLSSFEKLRAKLSANRTLTVLMHMDNMVLGIAFGTAVTCWRNIAINEYKGTFNHVKFQDIVDSVPKEFPIKGNRFAQTNQENFSKIPGAPIAYWASENFLNIFKEKKFKDFGFSCIGMRTGNNERFLRFWNEVPFSKMGIGCKSYSESIARKKKWIPYCKGGEFRRWYGNNEYVVNWENNGDEIKENTKKNYPQLGDNLGWKISNEKFYFQKGLTWSGVGMGIFGVRCYPEGMIFDSGANSFFVNNSDYYEYFAGLLNTKIVYSIIQMINPTINTGCGVIASLPAKVCPEVNKEVKELVRHNVLLSKNDWDSFENSWDFQIHPLNNQSVRSVEKAYSQWEVMCKERFIQLKTNEERLNKIFIDIYGLQDELTPEVDDKDVTVRKADKEREVKSLISYAVGCMFGRYSLDKPGLIYAGGEWDPSQYKKFAVDPDNIIPITEEADFEDDVVKRFEEFLVVTYGKETLEENLQFVADALGGKGTSREVIRGYFLNGFFDNHKTVYQKRPIYWLLDSGKNNGFKGLIYLHRYDADLLSRVRTDYLHPQQGRYAARVQELDRRIAKAEGTEKVRLQKERSKAFEQEEELRVFEERIHHLADQRIELDLDDGVKVNYAKLQDVLAKIK